MLTILYLLNTKGNQIPKHTNKSTILSNPSHNGAMLLMVKSKAANIGSIWNRNSIYYGDKATILPQYNQRTKYAQRQQLTNENIFYSHKRIPPQIPVLTPLR